jgi:DNA-binding NarL/FixJ family response regulator
MDSIRVLIVDDHRLFRQGLVSLLRSEPGFEVIGEASSQREALQLLRDQRPDVAVLDLVMPDTTGTELIEQVLLACVPPPGVIVLTASEDSVDLVSAIQAGAAGYIEKNADADALFSGIRKVHAGGAAVCDMAMPLVFEVLRGLPMRSQYRTALLTPREQEVLALIEDGEDNARISSRLFISENTVKTHVSHILDKLGLRSRAELVTSGAHPSRDINLHRTKEHRLTDARAY